jgi:hypothetical protein
VTASDILAVAAAGVAVISLLARVVGVGRTWRPSLAQLAAEKQAAVERLALANLIRSKASTEEVSIPDEWILKRGVAGGTKFDEERARERIDGVAFLATMFAQMVSTGIMPRNRRVGSGH